MLSPKLLAFDESGPEALITFEVFDGESVPDLTMKWVTDTLPDYSATPGPFTHRVRCFLDSEHGALSILVGIADMLGTASAEGVCPKLDPSVLALLNSM